ncbi:hypothetical protein BH23PLA1_BH23PLA1_04200 [soil metagenome]
MTDNPAKTEAAEHPDIAFATMGTGPLLERDYFAVFEGVECSPEDLAHKVRCHFEEFAPKETAVFRRDEEGSPLDVGDELVITLALLGRCRVRVVCFDDRSLTLRTLKWHPESGRITFGAGRDEQGRLTFRIRSRTRASKVHHYLGYLVMGKQMQSRCWINFLGNLAESCGGKVLNELVHVRSYKVEPVEADGRCLEAPTFTEDEPPRPGCPK